VRGIRRRITRWGETGAPRARHNEGMRLRHAGQWALLSLQAYVTTVPGSTARESNKAAPRIRVLFARSAAVA